ncbi:MAG: biotin/lipoyl-containing protein [Prevotella sp.]
MKEFKYIIDDKEYKVEIGNIVDNVVQVIVNGEDFQVQLEEEKEVEVKKPVLGAPVKAESVDTDTPDSSNVNTDNAVKAPLPGVITEIKVAIGDEIKTGDTVVVLEAMKMANNIEAEHDGKVTAILVKQGESVMEDTPLVVVE